jgi:hypothetical protein
MSNLALAAVFVIAIILIEIRLGKMHRAYLVREAFKMGFTIGRSSGEPPETMECLGVEVEVPDILHESSWWVSRLRNALRASGVPAEGVIDREVVSAAVTVIRGKQA